MTKSESKETMHQSESSRGCKQETALVCIDGHHYLAFKGDTMIAASGCSCHLVRNGEFLEEAQDIKESISDIGERQMLGGGKYSLSDSVPGKSCAGTSGGPVLCHGGIEQRRSFVQRRAQEHRT